MGGKKYYFIGVLTGIIAVIVVNFALNAVVAGGLPSLGFMAGDPKATGAPLLSRGKTEDLDAKISEIYKVLDKYYVGSYDKIETKESMYAGLVAGVGDPYTNYMDVETYTDFMEDTEGVYAGIGVVVTVNQDDNSIMVIAPFEGSPGYNAGILPGDKIIKVNGYDVNGSTIDDAITMMKGQPGTSVNVTIYRDSDGASHEMDIIRDNITVETVSHKMWDGDIGYIRITQFERPTFDQFAAAYDDLVQNGMKGLIIDVRNNPGGLLNVVCNIADMLVPEGTIVYTEDKSGRKEYIHSDANRVQVPLLILVNGHSASASEVLSGAVKDLGIGELVGEQTFGKGLVQNLFQLSDGSAVKVTIAKYYTPSGVCIQGEGIAPDHFIEMDTKLAARISTITPEEDVQLQGALEIMAKKIAAQ